MPVVYKVKTRRIKSGNKINIKRNWRGMERRERRKERERVADG